MTDVEAHPLFDAVDDAWFEVDAEARVVRVLTRAASELVAPVDPAGQPLRRLLAAYLSGDDLKQLAAAAASDLTTPRRIPAMQLVTANGARLCDLRLRRAPAGDGHVLVGFEDVTDSLRQRAALDHAQANARLAEAVLGADRPKLQEYLQSASVTVALIKSLLQLPARDATGFRNKLERILAEVLTLRGEAEALGLTAVGDSAHGFEAAVAAIALRDAPNGDEFLPLAARLNDLFTHLTAATAMVEMRSTPPKPAVPPRVGKPWAERCETRLRAFARRLAGSDGHRAELMLLGLEHVPDALQDSVDGMLSHLIGNACEHGIEAADQRIAAGKRAHGTVTIEFSRGDGTLELSVQDDGQGFDTAKLGRAAVARGLISAEALADTPQRALVGLIFRPGFSTAPVSAPGRGLGMEFLRELVARLDGRINVATKSRQYTRFRISLPIDARNAAARRA